MLVMRQQKIAVMATVVTYLISRKHGERNLISFSLSETGEVGSNPARGCSLEIIEV
tara:strand:- start:504 stop:671 length:168 start_codon:yes stop_codon:yes gene_type:complete